jgi:DNA-binding NarL/FixJ family response regulator
VLQATAAERPGPGPGTGPNAIIVASARPWRRSAWRHGAPPHLTVLEASKLDALRGLLVQQSAGFLLLDLEFPGVRGIPDIAELHRLSPATRMLVMSRSMEDRIMVSFLRAGAIGCCDPDVNQSTLRKAIAGIAEGELWVSRRLIPYLLQDIELGVTATLQLSIDTHPRLSMLTDRQRQIVAALVTGGSNREIATRLGLAEKTVKSHFTSIFRRLGVTHRLQLVLLLTASQRN